MTDSTATYQQPISAPDPRPLQVREPAPIPPPLVDPWRGKVVYYYQGGKTYNALVLLSHSQNDFHLGTNAEPTLHLAVLFDDVKGKTQPIGYIPQVTVVHDVVHASQVFSAKYRADNGLVTAAQVAERRGAGEWREAAISPAVAKQVAGQVVGDTVVCGHCGKSKSAHRGGVYCAASPDNTQMFVAK
jgi:hypothetical protein